MNFSCRSRSAVRPSDENSAPTINFMNAIILFSHGSLLCGSGEALKRHAARLQAQNLAPFVTVGYLNYSEPRFIDSVAECVANGAVEILIAPYFLISGYFIKVDLPRCLAEAQERFPQVTFRIGEALGYDTRLANALLDSAANARTSETWRDDLTSAANFCRDNPECPLYPTSACPHTQKKAVI